MYICLLVNAVLWEESPQRRPTMHVVGLHSIDHLQIVGVSRLHINNNLDGYWKSEQRRLTMARRHKFPWCGIEQAEEDHHTIGSLSS